MKHTVLIAGFGGQGVMLMGELLSYAAMLDGKQVTYMPSYGPEMRGGTANCSVIIADEIISSPIITAPNIFVAMNEPSLDKFEDHVESGGLIFTNSALIDREVRRDDTRDYPVDCVGLARAAGNEKTANIVMLGAVISASGIVSSGVMSSALERKFCGRKAKSIPINQRALTAWQESRGDT
jgi:2-oxoglutarate ferredoxin oxidoreductase subunit gamma